MMEPRLRPDYRHFTVATHHNTRAIPLPSGSYDDDTVALILAMTTLALMISVTVSMLVFLKIV
jgi:hypothetical protein